ncbi:MAG: TVP38/TMEM64 family protein [Chloroflexota bacterium]
MTSTTKTITEFDGRAMNQTTQNINPSESEPSFLSQHWQKIVAVALWVALIGLYTWYSISQGLTPLGAVQQLLSLMQNSFYGPLIFVGLYALRPLIFFSAAILTIAGGFLFGPVLGIIYTIIAANLSAMVAFLIGRYLGDGLINTDEEGGIVQKYAQRMKENSFETVLIMRFIFLPYDLVNYLGGLLRLDWKAFLIATAIGSIPGTVSFVLFGAALEDFSLENGFPELDWRTLAAGGVLFLLSILISQYVKRREQNSTSA